MKWLKDSLCGCSLYVAALFLLLTRPIWHWGLECAWRWLCLKADDIIGIALLIVVVIGLYMLRQYNLQNQGHNDET